MKTIINKLQQVPRFLFTITLFSILAACGGGGSSSSTPAPVVQDDASLKSLSLSIGTLSPAFTSNVTNYTFTTTAETTTVTPTVNQSTATVKVNTTAVESGSASTGIPLNKGDNSITIIVTTADASTQTYHITVTRIDVSPTDANLWSLVLSAGSLSPAFASDVTNYTLTATASTTTVTPAMNQSTATVKVNNSAVNSGSASGAITLATGQTTINIIVTAPDKIATKTYTITVTRVANVEFINPDAADATNHKFGQQVVQLGNGNIVIYAPGYGTDNGAVHFYKPTSDTAVASFYGTKAGDRLGTGRFINSGGIIALANDNFLIVSPYEDKGALGNAGSVRLVNGSTGKIIKNITGNNAADQLANGGITLLNDNQFVITSPYYHNNDQQVGSVLVINDKGDTVNALYGNTFGITHLGDQGVTALRNNNFVIASTSYSQNDQTYAGIVQLVNSKGELIQSINGQSTKTDEGFYDGITPLKNGNFLIASHTYDAPSEGNLDLTNAGSIQLINGSTGVAISRLVGDKKDGHLGLTSTYGYSSGGTPTNPGTSIRVDATTTIIPLENSNYVVLHHTADNGTTKNAGSLRLFSGANGAQIGATVRGDFEDDFKQTFAYFQITVLGNHNYVVSTPFSDKTVGGETLTDVGSIRLMSGVNGAELAIKHGDNKGDQLGFGDVIGLSNHKYVVASPNYNGFKGAVMLFNDKGVLEGAPNIPDFSFGFNALTALGNNKFVIASAFDGNGNQGSIRLADADVVDNGNIKEIAVIYGDSKDDNIGNRGVTLLNNHNFVLASPNDDVNGITDAGSVQAVNGTTGAKATDRIVGLKTGDMNSAQMIKPATAGDYFILSQPLVDDYGTDAGKVRLVVPTF